MKRLFPVLTFALLILGLAATPVLAQSDHAMDHEKHHTQMHEADATLQPEIIDGVQVVEITVTPRGYSADRIALRAGLPARLVFKRTVDGGCAHQVQAPDLGIENTDLPLDEPVAIEFTPKEEGEYTFTCGMRMLKGTLLVTL